MTATCQLYRDGVLEDEAMAPERVSDVLQENGSLVWLDLVDPSEADLAMIEEEFAIHPLAMEDVRHQNQRPKVEVFEDFMFIVLHDLGWADEELVDSEIHVFVGTNYLVTLRYTPTFDLTKVKARWQRKELRQEGGGFLLYALFDEIVDDYFDLVEKLEDVSEDLEELVFAEETPEDIQERIFKLKKKVITFRRRVMPLREVLDLLQEDAKIVTRRLEPYYRDVADHVIRTLEFIDNVRDLLTSALEAHMSMASHRMNEVMKSVTSWGAIILVPTLIAGIYGMNFNHMPELHWLWGYPFALGVMLLSAGALYGMFKRRGWL